MNLARLIEEMRTERKPASKETETYASVDDSKESSIVFEPDYSGYAEKVEKAKSTEEFDELIKEQDDSINALIQDGMSKEEAEQLIKKAYGYTPAELLQLVKEESQSNEDQEDTLKWNPPMGIGGTEWYPPLLKRRYQRGK